MIGGIDMTKETMIGERVFSERFGEGEVVDYSPDSDNLSVLFSKSIQKTLKLSVAFNSGALRFKNDAINTLLLEEKQIGEAKEEADKEEIKAAREMAIAENERIVKTLEALIKERDRRERYFGSDYVYEELERFIKENKRAIINNYGSRWKERIDESFSWEISHSITEIRFSLAGYKYWMYQ